MPYATILKANFHSSWGPTISGEWSQADTDCTEYINNVGAGSRWEGTLDGTTTPACPGASSCTCDPANAAPSDFSSEYKSFLQTFAEGQMYSFEQGWGWFYWTWKTESAYTWSWKSGTENGYLPSKAYSPSFTCGTAPDFAASGLPEYY